MSNVKTIRQFSLGTPWVFVLVTVVLWVLLYVLLESVLFGGQWVSAVSRGAFGGFVCGLTVLAWRRYEP